MTNYNTSQVIIFIKRYILPYNINFVRNFETKTKGYPFVFIRILIKCVNKNLKVHLRLYFERDTLPKCCHGGGINIVLIIDHATANNWSPNGFYF